jgi:hypothetical protein
MPITKSSIGQDSHFSFKKSPIFSKKYNFCMYFCNVFKIRMKHFLALNILLFFTPRLHSKQALYTYFYRRP